MSMGKGRSTAGDHKGLPFPTPPPSPLRTDNDASTNPPCKPTGWGTKRLDKSAKSWYICSMNCKLWMNPQEAAVSLGIAVKTLRRWDKAGKLHGARTAGHHRRIGMAEIQCLQRQGEQAVRCALYARVSTGLQAQEGNWQQVRLEVLDPPAQVDPTTDLLAAVLTIVTAFSGKLYAYRADANPHRKKTLPMLVSTSEQEERAA